MSSQQIVIFINGKLYPTDGWEPSDSLVDFIRHQPGLKGTKSSRSGYPGYTSVVASCWSPSSQAWSHRLLAACSTTLASVHRHNITTVEGVGTPDRPHIVQNRLVECNGIQSGYDSPGVVVAMFSLLLKKRRPTLEDIEQSQNGVISRDNGYRAVFEAFKVFTLDDNDERSKFEAKLPEQLKIQEKLPSAFKGSKLTWHFATSEEELKSLQKAGGPVAYGTPHPKSLLGHASIIDASHLTIGDGVVLQGGLASIPATIRLEDLLEILVNAQTKSPIQKELLQVLRKTKTSQYREATAFGDAIKECIGLRVFLLSTGAKLSNANAVDNESVLFEDVYLDGSKSSFLYTIIPDLGSDEHVVYYNIGARKANPSNSVHASIKATMLGDELKDINGFWGKALNEEKKMRDMGSILMKGKKSKTVKGADGIDMEDVLLDKFVDDLTGLAYSNGTVNGEADFERVTMESNGVENGSTNGDLNGTRSDPFGRSIPNVAGLSCATGKAVFTEDMPPLKDELHMFMVTSPIAKGKIVKIDPSKALAVPGVVRFISAKDFPAGKNVLMTLGNVNDEDIFAEEQVQYEGHPVGAILADTDKAAREAARLVEMDFEEETAIVSLEEAMSQNSFIPFKEEDTTKSFIKGNVDDAFAESETILEGSVKTSRQEHFYEETLNCVVVPVGEDDEYKVYIPTANVLRAQQTIARLLDIPFSRILVHTKRVGNSFGGKISRYLPLACATAFAAKLTERPVKCHYTREQDIKISGQRGEFIVNWKVGVKDGKITGAEYYLHKNAGWSTDMSRTICTYAINHMDAGYAFPAMKMDSMTYKTNTPSNTAFRGFGSPIAHITTENMVFDICVELGLDPVEFMKANLQQPGYVNHYEQVMDESDVTHGLCMDKVIQDSDYYNLRKEVEDFNINNTNKKRGLYLIPNKYGVGMAYGGAQGGALLNIYTDGSVLLSYAGIELGQGLQTKMIQIVAHELGITMDKIRVSESANDKVPNPTATGGTSTADLNGNALKNCCDQINERLQPLRDANPDGTWEDLVKKAYGSRVNLSASGYYVVPFERVNFDMKTKKGNRWWYFTCGAAVSMVELDLLTGCHTLLSTNIVMDVGQAINPAIDIANIEAAFMQGYGWVAMEDTEFAKDGKLLSDGYDTYNLPTMSDCPKKFDVSLLKNGSTKEHILYSSKGIGEPPFFNGCSVYYAIKDAVHRARKERGATGRFDLHLPTTPDNVRKAIWS